MEPDHNRCVEQDLRELAKLIGGNQAQIATALKRNGFSINKFHALRSAIKKSLGYDDTTVISIRNVAGRLRAEDEANDITNIVTADSLKELISALVTKPLTQWQRNQIERWEVQRRENQAYPILLNPPVDDHDEAAMLRADNERLRAEIKDLQDRLRWLTTSTLDDLIADRR